MKETTILHKALNIIYDQHEKYGYPTGIQKIDDSTVDITFDNLVTTKVRIFVDEEKVVEL